MLLAALLIIGVQYFTEMSMKGILDTAADTSNNEYDFSLPFVMAVDDELPDIFPGAQNTDLNKDGSLWFSNNLANPTWDG